MFPLSLSVGTVSFVANSLCCHAGPDWQPSTGQLVLVFQLTCVFVLWSAQCVRSHHLRTGLRSAVHAQYVVLLLMKALIRGTSPRGMMGVGPPWRGPHTPTLWVYVVRGSHTGLPWPINPQPETGLTLTLTLFQVGGLWVVLVFTFIPNSQWRKFKR